MNYDECVIWLKTMLEVPLNDEDANFTRILPAMFIYADGRIYRELNFLATDTVTEILLSPMQRDHALPANVLTVREFAVLTPQDPMNQVTLGKTRNFPERVSPEAVDMFWPQGGYKPGVPIKYAVVGYRVPPASLPSPPPPPNVPPLVYLPEEIILRLRFMPVPDRSYTAEIYGTIRPAILSRTNPETYLSRNYADLFLAACMVFGAGYQRDFGAQADDPGKAVSWEGTYTSLRQGVLLESLRQRGLAPPAAPAPQGAA